MLPKTIIHASHFNAYHNLFSERAEDAQSGTHKIHSEFEELTQMRRANNIEKWHREKITKKKTFSH